MVRISRAQGEFAPRGDGPLLLVAAGSGITPMRSLLEALAAADPQRDVVLLHGARSAADRIFADELRAISASNLLSLG